MIQHLVLHGKLLGPLWTFFSLPFAHILFHSRGSDNISVRCCGYYQTTEVEPLRGEGRKPAAQRSRKHCCCNISGRLLPLEESRDQALVCCNITPLKQRTKETVCTTTHGAIMMMMRSSAMALVATVFFAAFATPIAGQEGTNCEVSDLDEYEFMVSFCSFFACCLSVYSWRQTESSRKASKSLFFLIA